MKSRWATDYDKSFPIKNFACDFVVHVALNRGIRFRSSKRPQSESVRRPQFYVFPVDVVRLAQNRGDKWGKVTITHPSDRNYYVIEFGTAANVSGNESITTSVPGPIPGSKTDDSAIKSIEPEDFLEVEEENEEK